MEFIPYITLAAFAFCLLACWFLLRGEKKPKNHGYHLKGSKRRAARSAQSSDKPALR